MAFCPINEAILLSVSPAYAARSFLAGDSSSIVSAHSYNEFSKGTSVIRTASEGKKCY